MAYYKWLLIIGLAYLIISYIRFATGVLPSRWRINPAPALGSVVSGIRYSFTGAMSPTKKESAYLHFPTYIAGLVFHLSLFMAILNIIIRLINLEMPIWADTIFLVLFSAGAVCGISILIKRIASPLLRYLSNPDDYISNIVVTLFQLLTVLSIYKPQFTEALFIYAFFLLAYIPFGKLRHSFYFFTSRIALGMFYGSRGVWGKK